jgi:hypothetical protein
LDAVKIGQLTGQSMQEHHDRRVGGLEAKDYDITLHVE